jgi:hypothetical protein
MIDPKKLSACTLERFEMSNARFSAGMNASQRQQAAMQEAIAPLVRRQFGGAVFNLGDEVETVKGAKFWGQIIAFDHDDAVPGCTVRAVDPGFDGTKHVYPLKQVRHRRVATSDPCEEAPEPPDYFAELVARARAVAIEAAARYPQPNYIVLKIAEEAGEVVRGAVHFAEGRMDWAEVEGEIVQLLAMLVRFVHEGDQVNGIVPPHVAATIDGRHG